MTFLFLLCWCVILEQTKGEIRTLAYDNPFNFKLTPFWISKIVSSLYLTLAGSEYRFQVNKTKKNSNPQLQKLWGIVYWGYFPPFPLSNRLNGLWIASSN